MPSPTIVKAVQTCTACPSQWDAWTDTGQYLYLRYRWGVGTVEKYPSEDTATWTDEAQAVAEIASFDTGGGLDGCIDLAEFCERAGIAIALDADISTGRGDLCRSPSRKGPKTDDR